MSVSDGEVVQLSHATGGIPRTVAFAPGNRAGHSTFSCAPVQGEAAYNWCGSRVSSPAADYHRSGCDKADHLGMPRNTVIVLCLP